jgi:2-polyprenyl-6-methoxyphenol hydroxylase-like FAD-dependent oxidoreductase
VHRGRLLMTLFDAVQERMGPETVRTGLRLNGFREAGDGSGRVVADFEGPEGPVSESADLLIGADGIHSVVRAQTNPGEGAPVWNGMVMWRATTHADPFLTGRSMIMASDGARKFVCYPLSAPDPETGKVLTNWVAEVPLPDRPVLERGNWNRETDKAEIEEHFGSWRFDWLDVSALIESATAVYEYPMVDRDPLEQWTEGRATLLGDAAHAMHPVGSNGASQAIIDARVLAHALATSESVEAALARYEELRRPATAAIQTSNRRMGPEIVMRIAHQRAPEGFARIDDVMAREELESIAEAYKRTAGFHPAALNERASYSVGRREDRPG